MKLFLKIIIAVTLLGLVAFSAVSVKAAPTSNNIFRTLLPETTGTYDFGSVSKVWNYLYVNNICLSGDCKSAWPAGGSGTFPFTSTINYGALTNATGTPLWFQLGLQASSTSYFNNTNSINATTSSQYISGQTWLTALSGGTLNVGSAGLVYSKSTSTPSVTAPIAYSGTLGDFIGGVSGAFSCIVATRSVAGCLSSTDFTTFDNKISSTSLSVTGPLTYNSSTGVIANTGLATTSQPSSSNILVSNGGAGVYGVATTSVTCSGNTTCTSFTAIGASPITISSTGGGTGLSTSSPTANDQVLVYNSAGAGSAYSVATTSLTVSGPFTIANPIGVLKNGAITYTGLATTSALTQGQLLYNTTGGNGVASVGTSTLSGTTNQLSVTNSPVIIGNSGAVFSLANNVIFPISFNATYGTTTFASSTALTATRLFSTDATTTSLAITNTSISQLLYSGAGGSVLNVATGTVSAGSSAITVTAGRAVIGGALSIDCATASASQNGCLSSTDYTTFTNKTSWPFTPATYGTQAVQSTTTALWLRTATPYNLIASSTYATYASSTQLTVEGNTYLATLGGAVAIGTTSPNSPLSIRGGNTSTAINKGVVQIGVAAGQSASGIELGTTNVTGANKGFLQGFLFTTGALADLVINPFGGNTLINPLAGLAGVGSSSPYARLSVHGNPTDSPLATTLFAIGSSTASATTTLFSVSNTGSIFTQLGTGCVSATAGVLSASGSCGGSGTFAWTPTTNFGIGANSTSTPIWLRGSTIALMASSTSMLSTTTVYGALHIDGRYAYGSDQVSSVPLTILASTTGLTTIIENTLADATLNVRSSASYGAAYVNLYSTAAEYNGISGYMSDVLKWRVGRSGASNGFYIYTLDGNTLAGQFTDTQQLYLPNQEGIGTTSPSAKLSIHANPTDATKYINLLTIGSSTASATSTLFKVNNIGVVSIGGVAGNPLWSIFNQGGNFYIATTSGGDATSSPMVPLSIVGSTFGSRVGINIGAPRGTLDLYEQNGTGASPSIVMGGNAGGDTDWWIGRISDNSGTDNALDYFRIGRDTVPGTNPQFTINNIGLTGIGSSTPWALLSVASSTWGQNPLDFNRPLFAVATSSSSFGQLFNIYATSTTLTHTLPSGAKTNDSGVRASIGEFITYLISGILDQFFVNGRINTGDWKYSECNHQTAGTTNLTSNTANACNDWAFDVDTSGNFSEYATSTLGYELDLGNGNAITNLNSVNSGGGLFGPPANTNLNIQANNTNQNGPLLFGTTTPVMEMVARIVRPQNATSTRYMMGFTNICTSGCTTIYEREPTSGCWFVASTSPAGGASGQANWQAQCRTSMTNTTTVDTGFASTTNMTNTGEYYRFRIEADANKTVFYMASSTSPLHVVAIITTNRSLTDGYIPSVVVSSFSAGLTKVWGINVIKLWWQSPLGF